MATNGNAKERDNRVWLSLREELVNVRSKLRKIYKDEDIYVEGLIPLAKKHGCLPDLSSTCLEMDMHLHGSLDNSREPAPAEGS
jgi:hypothetical protein